MRRFVLHLDKKDPLFEVNLIFVPYEVVPLRVDFSKMAAVVMETVKMLNKK
jgi:hypothetical protein